MLTIGLVPNIAKLLVVGGATIVQGNMLTNSALILGAIAISHPLEVMRIRSQYSGVESWKISGGLKECFKGFTPRTAALFPIMLFANYKLQKGRE